MRRACVIDNSTLVTLTKLYHLSIFESLQYLFYRIHIPLEIKREYENILAMGHEPIRHFIIQRMKLNSGFLSICSQYDSIALGILKTAKGIDLGEAEVAAQHKSVGSSYVISDDKDFIKGLRKADRHIKVLGTLHIIAWLDCLRIISPRDYLAKIYEHGPFKSSELRTAYEEIQFHLGISVSKRELNKKSSLKELGLFKA